MLTGRLTRPNSSRSRRSASSRSRGNSRSDTRKCTEHSAGTTARTRLVGSRIRAGLPPTLRGPLRALATVGDHAAAPTRGGGRRRTSHPAAFLYFPPSHHRRRLWEQELAAFREALENAEVPEPGAPADSAGAG